MATSPYTVANKPILDKMLRDEAWFKTFWAKFAGFASRMNDGRWDLSGKAIDVFNAPRTEGRNEILVPMLRPLIEYPKIGKETLKGDTEVTRYLWHKVFVHLVRQGVEVPDTVDLQKIKWTGVAKRLKPALVDWWARWENHDVTRALLEGFSYHVTDSTYGLSKTKRYNKNTWIWAGDTSENNFTTNAPTFSYTSSSYKSSLITKFGTLAAADSMDTKTLEELAPLVSYSNLQPIMTKEGYEFYPMIIHSRQAASLRQDSDWLAAQGRANTPGMQNPIFNGTIGHWGKLAIYVNDVVARLGYATGSTLDFFNYSGGTDYSTSGTYAKVQTTGTNQHATCALILGKGALSKAVDTRLGFAEEQDDFGMIKEIGSSQFYGYARNDYYDEEIDGSTAATDQAEPQSAVVVTYQ